MPSSDLMTKTRQIPHHLQLAADVQTILNSKFPTSYMAKPIEPTPVLSGKDAEAFLSSTKQEERMPDKKRLNFLEECYRAYHQQKF